ncbi:hypothetical protein CkaCkLH20_01840 [Colletotrichum karsti]|uniref:25S rRNA (Uridine(2843)-N(3))-methyltransferase n=1 Tax=Colletotrichum karsti TaxID=1095194 RepID=A0A9P6LP84_9PEZI|nr:uncharacterized protein CkaCkLH20_01840 [Colletotrichum karsti]KAF9880798.1 hypothetical protein CkaCkLH20_01840 [Colletotrichum karsti]
MGKKVPPKQQFKPKPKPKPQPSKPAQPPPAEPQPPTLPLPLQQTLLATFNTTFSPVLGSDAFPSLLQECKAALYARDFETAFANASRASLDAYAARWSPTRALAYAAVLLGVAGHLRQDVVAVRADSGEDDAVVVGTVEKDVAFEKKDAEEEEKAQPKKSVRMLSVGGGAAEIVAFAAYLASESLKGEVVLLDSAPWDDVVAKLHTALTTPPPLSKYASAATKASNAALIAPEDLRSTFTRRDVLSLTREAMAETMGKEALLVTLLFTLNELYTSAGIGKTTTFLLNLTATIPSGSLLLVVDSPGSYSEAAVGKESKRYPMQWLLDHTLVKDEPVEGCLWEKLESHDSVWFRLAETLQYPISLENMRYQMHLYRATRP